MVEIPKKIEKIPPRIKIRPNGPLIVQGDVPLVHKTQVVSEYGEPLTWKKDGELKQKGPYSLCRCGKSKEMPYCDGSHNDFDFDGTETADIRPTAERQETLAGGTGIIVKKDDYLCMESGFCANRLTSIDEMVSETGEPRVRAEIMAMIERCPAGVYVYSTKEGEEDIEPDLPVQVAATTEITQYGPIMGPLWVTGNVPVLRSDGQPFETRNRVTLCSCGLSCKKPLCDGTHRAVQEEELRKAKEKDNH
jgi:CDGSH-type Zn-finger protein